MKKNLVIARCGKDSLHPQWLKGEVPRNWDLILCPFQEIPPTPEALYTSEIIVGQKWLGVHAVLTNWEGWRNYAYIWLPDDDLLMDAATINRFFELSNTFDANMSAPSLTPDSHYSHFIAMHNTGFAARAVTFIEIMMPCFKREVLELCLPSIGAHKTGYSWGLDFIWPKLLKYEGLIIFDMVQVRHTRPVAMLRDEKVQAQCQAEMDHIINDLQTPAIFRVMSGWDEDGRYRQADNRAFMRDYLAGYRHLLTGSREKKKKLKHIKALQSATVPRI